MIWYRAPADPRICSLVCTRPSLQTARPNDSHGYPTSISTAADPKIHRIWPIAILLHWNVQFSQKIRECNLRQRRLAARQSYYTAPTRSSAAGSGSRPYRSTAAFNHSGLTTNEKPNHERMKRRKLSLTASLLNIAKRGNPPM